MKKRALRKDFYMEVRKSLNRFVSIFLIVALGVAFYSGIQSAAPDMRYSGDTYFDAHRLMDLKVIGTLGLTSEDVREILGIHGIETAEPGYMTDVLCGVEEAQKVLRVESISPTLNQLTPVEGRLPERQGEVFVDIEFLDKTDYEIGDTITFHTEEGNELPLKQDTFTIVGAGSSPLYISFNRGSTTLGNGELSGAAYLLAENFDLEVYTQIYLRVQDASTLTTYTDAYDTLIKTVQERVEAIADQRCEIRYAEVKKEADEQLLEAKQELENGKQEGESELEEAKKELIDGEQKLAEGKQKLEDARIELADGEQEVITASQKIAENEALLLEKQQELSDGKIKLEDGWTQFKAGEETLAKEETAFQTVYETSMAELTAGETQIAQAESELAVGKQEYEASTAKYEQGKADYEAGEVQYASGIEALKKQEEEWPKKKEELEGEKAKLEGQLFQVEAALPPLEEGLLHAKTKQTEAEQSVSELQSQIDALQVQIESLETQITAFQSQQSTLREQLEIINIQIASLQGEIDAVNSQILSCEQAIANGNEIPVKEQEVAVLSAQIAELQKNPPADGTGETQIAALSSKKEKLEQEIADLLNKKSEAEALLPGLLEQQSTLQAQQSEQQQNLVKIQQEQTQIQTQIDPLLVQKETLCQQMDPLQSTMQTAQQNLAECTATVTELQTQFDTMSGTIESLKNGIAQCASYIAQGEAGISQGKAQLAQTRIELDAAKKELDLVPGQLEAAKQKLETGEQEIAAKKEQISNGKKQLSDGKKKIEQAKNELQGKKQKLLDSQTALTEGETQLADGWQKLSEAKQTLTEGQKKLEDGRKEIADAEQEISENEQKLIDGKQEYEDGVKEFEEEIADAEQEIADAEQEIKELKYPEWMVTDRSALPENIGYGENADRIRNIGQVFPVLFFLVAALISLTTMTRMVEEERTQIGTLKALGYGKMAIASKYLMYAFTATLGGSVFGILLGEKFLPYIIVTAYRIMYHHMTDIVLPYNIKYAFTATLAALVCTLGATFAACWSELAEVPAMLMRPPAPKEGKRVLLERIPFFWKHLSFSWKSTVRNLFRYKKRFFMTVFGIGGCMALMLVGYGLRDSISEIGTLQFEQLQLYDAMIILDGDAEKEQEAQLMDVISKEEDLENHTKTLMQKMSVSKDRKTWDVYLMVPEDTKDFFVYRDRETKEPYELTGEGAIVTEKIASLLGIKAGDTIVLEEEEHGKVEIPVAAVTENYLSHYIYLTPKLYEDIYKKAPEYNEVLIRAKENISADALTHLGQKFLSYDAALSVSYAGSLMMQIKDMLSTLDSVIVVLIVSAGLLAFVVLYNLSNININERRRELATIKVLGFYDNEVDAYVYRETILITLIGIAAGVLMGRILHYFVITTVEVDATMFGRNINVFSFVISAIFTAIFSLIVNVVMHFKLKKIDMVESLKSVE